MMFKWLDATEARKFGISMAEFFAQRIQPESIPANEKKPLKKVAHVISKLHEQSILFRTNHKPNFYQKAKLWNAFQWKLFDLGYDKKIVEELTKDLLRNF